MGDFGASFVNDCWKRLVILSNIIQKNLLGTKVVDV